ncbi:MAG: PAS domain S-box protein [Ignavibacteriales bacterium]|nr:PAS domain S-box protein [Ignavibacteriales bacterium]
MKSKNTISIIDDASLILNSKATIDSLFDQENTFKKLIEFYPDILIVQKEGMIVYINPAGAKLLGGDPENFIGQFFIDFVHPDFKEEVKLRYNKFLSNRNQNRLFEKKLLRLDNTAIFVETASRQIKLLGEKVILVVARDISNRKIIEQHLKESEERFRTLSENSYDLICEINANSKFIYLSPNLKEILGYDPSELLQKSIFSYIHPHDWPGVLDELKKGYGSVILRYMHKNGEWRWFESAGRKYTTVKGEVRGVIVSRDITERKLLEQKLIQTEKLMAIGEMSAMIAHEFRNALTSVKMILQLTIESENLTSTEKKSFDVAINSIFHMESVVQQLLHFSLPTSTEMKLENLNSVLNDCLPFIKMQANKKNIKVIKKFDASIPLVLINNGTMKESIINLLLNATQSFDNFSSRISRKISITSKRIFLDETIRDIDYTFKFEKSLMKHESNTDIEIVMEKGNECALIEIKDNGCGIEKYYLSRIFEPFFTTKEKGSGLGLSIVKRTINGNNGIIKVETRKLKGTTFKIYLPILRRGK